jgi:outer membrane protein assembly factor BamD (BamD/ComL family)
MSIKNKIQSLTSAVILLSGVTLIVGTQSSFAAKQKISQVFPEGERLLMSKITSSYQKQDLMDVVTQQESLAKNYPGSVYLDQAIYLRGYLELNKGRYAEALRAFSALDQKRPLSPKRPEALFAMAMTYKKLNLPQQADSVLTRLQKSYPGSPESRRASLERRLIRVK